MSTTGSSPSRDGRRFTSVISGLTALGLLMALLLATIFFTLPSNVLSVRDGGPLRSAALAYMPEGWSFFTKPPSDHDLVPYAQRPGGDVKSLSRFPQSAPGNLMGISRKQRAQGTEVGEIAQGATEWLNCREQFTNQCVEAAFASEKVNEAVNSSAVSTLCGRIVLLETSPVDWAYRNRYDEHRYNVRAALMEVECSAGG
ncbi:SdpA family antimicrobial peptide system protein [Rhodococcoides yunnanense]|uniref:SdpA family antimicrobial peptide system protein n=1 Tax=Rhodococcoides yunnanense TaxID=278209 RepID=UPI0035301FA4